MQNSINKCIFSTPLLKKAQFPAEMHQNQQKKKLHFD